MTSTPPWGATAASTRNSTLADVTDEHVLAAGVLIESVAGLVGKDLSGWPSQSLSWLKRAVEYQAAYIAGQPDMFGQPTHSGRSERLDQASLTLTGIDDSKLAPLARDCLAHLGDSGVGVIRLRTTRAGARGYTRSGDSFNDYRTSSTYSALRGIGAGL